MRNRNKARKQKNNRLAIAGLILLFFFITSFLFLTTPNQETKYNQIVLENCKDLEEKLKNSNLDNIEIINKANLPIYSGQLKGNTSNYKTEKYKLKPSYDSKFNYNTNNESIEVCVYDDHYNLVKDRKLQSSVLYSIFIISNKEQQYKIDINLDPSTSKSNTKSNSDQEDTIFKISYNVENTPQLKNSLILDKIIKQILQICEINNFPTDDLSITLINLKNDRIANYKEQIYRYPASVAKLFWLATFYSYINKEKNIDVNSTLDKPKLNINSSPVQLIEEMISQSDNEASSKIIDLMTNTQSGSLDSADFKTWYKKRLQLNRFFKKANYSDYINISQKTYPIPYLDEYGERPKGLELKMRHLENHDENNPIRNRLTTYDSARLMYEIVNEKAVSPSDSNNMKNHLERDLDPKVWRNIDPNVEFNPILAFFGQGLPQNVRLLSKPGWTSSTRQEVAYIETPDQTTRYILAIFAENEAYAQNWNIFPKLSRFVFKEMKQLN